MTRRQTPQEKKQLEYDRDRYVDAEYPHLLRKRWPKKKAAVSRRERRRAERLVSGLRNLPADVVVETGEDAGITAEHVRSTRMPHALWKSGIRTVRERVADRVEKRARTAGFNLFKQPYDAALHRAPFAAFLASVVKGPPASTTSKVRAAHWARVLDPAPLHGERDQPWRERRREWTQAFFRDEPQWETWLREWIAACTPEPG
jgi:signal recognition particle subunit SEC65